MLCAPGTVVSKSSARRAKTMEALKPADRASLKLSVPAHISNYFRDMDLPEGADIHDPKWVDLCLDTGICEAVDMAYAAMAATGMYKSRDNALDDDVLLVVSILRWIRRSCVPQELSAGMLLMHLEIVEGLKFSNETLPSFPTS